MNRPQIAVAALSRKSVIEQIELGEAIVAALTDHPTVFADPNPALVIIVATTKELHDAKADADTGSHEGMQRLRKAKTAFAKVVGTYLDYVNMIAQGDGVIIEQSGLQVSRQAQKTGPTPAPENLKLTGKVAGQLEASVEVVERAKAYVWMYYVGIAPPTPDAEWRFSGGTPKARLSLTNLASGVRVWLRCAAVTSAGQGPWSEPVSRIVL